MTNCFQAWFDLMQTFEGGLSNHPADKGGLTNRGITWATFRQLAPRVGLPVNEQTLINLTKDEAAKFAKLFWDDVMGDNLPCGAAIIIADWYWGSGGYGVQRAQKVLGVTPDGVFGLHSVAAANQRDPSELVNALYKARAQHFADIVRADATQMVFLNGWNRRNDAMYNLASAYAIQDAEKKKCPRGPGRPRLES